MVCNKCSNKCITVIVVWSRKRIRNIFGFIIFGNKHQIQRHHCTDSEIFLILIFGTLIRIEEIPRKGSSKKCQSIPSTIIVLFYRHNWKRRSFFHQTQQSGKKTEWIKSTVSIANKILIHQIRYTLMVLTCLQSKTLINQVNHISFNQPVHMAAVNGMLIPFQGNINNGDSTGLKLYLWGTKEIDKETYKLGILFSNDKYIVDHFLSLANKYVRGCLLSMVVTINAAKNVFIFLEYILLGEI